MTVNIFADLPQHMPKEIAQTHLRYGQRDVFGDSISCRPGRRHHTHDDGHGLPPAASCKSGETISRKEEGCAFAITLRLAGLCLWLATFGYLLFPDFFSWASVPLPDWVRWVGAVTGTLCSLLMYWTLCSLGKNLTDTVVTGRRRLL